MRVLALFVCLIGLVSSDRDENPGNVLSKSAKTLMEMALPKTSAPDILVNQYEVETPTHDDLAISRLQTKVKTVLNSVWKILRDPQRQSVLQGQTGGQGKVVLSMVSQELKGDIFAVDHANEDHLVSQTLVMLQSQDHKGDLGSAGNRLAKIIGRVNSFYGYLQKYMDNQDDVSGNTLEDFARSIIEPGSKQEHTLQTALVELHNLSMPHLGMIHPQQGLLGSSTQRTDIYYKLFLLLNNKQFDSACSLTQSPHQLIFNLYNVIALTEVKGFLIMQFSYIMLNLYKRGDFTLESDLSFKSFQDQSTDKLLAVKGILQNMDRDYWKCDPASHQEGQTFVRMTQLLQGIIENEVDLNPSKSCKQECSDYTIAEVHGCLKDRICTKHRRCEGGRLFDCEFFNADAWVCISDNEERRYEYVHYENGIVLGKGTKESFCPKQVKVDSWWRWFYHCSMCMCKCDAPGPHSDRYWSLKPLTSDLSANKVVTGVRFTKKNRVIQIEIEQGRALPEGSILESSREWITPDPIDLDNDIPNRDYLMMTYETRALDTDLLEAPPGHVITGVRLRNLGGHVNLEVQITPIRFSSGKLVTDRSTWIANDNTPASANPRTQADIYMPDIPTMAHNSQIISTHNKYIEFDATSPHKDVMQTTIPFVDAQEVRPKPGIWLNAVGLYYKGQLGYGGFVGVMVQTYDYTRHLIPEE